MTEEADDVADQLADLNAYGKALNRADEEEHVVSLTLEAMSVLLELPQATFVLVRGGEPVVADSTRPERDVGEAAGELARRAIDSAEVVTASEDRDGAVAAAAVPVRHDGEAVAALVVREPSTDAFEGEALRPLELLASHAATALGNIRSREDLERTQRTLSARAELLELYGRLFRHHLRNDLNIAAGYVEMLAEDADDVQDELSTVRETLGRSIDLVDRVSALHVEIEGIDAPEPRSLRDAVAAAVEGATDGHDDLTVTVDPGAVDYEVYAGGGLESVFANLLENAAIHNEGPVTVSIDARAPGESTVAVSVADDGRGVPESVRETLFQLGVSGPESQGVGLGLGFVRRLVETYGGGIAHEENQAGGATFRIELERA